MRGRRVVVGMVAGAVGVLGLLPASASAAEADAHPVLTSVSVGTGAASPGSPGTVEVVATDDVGIAGVTTRWVNRDSLGPTAAFEVVSDPATGRGEWVVAPSSSDGPWQLDSVALVDTAGQRATYYANGQLVRSRVPVAQHTVDLGGAVVRVSGATDRSGPILEGVGSPSANPLPGEEVSVPYRVTDVSLPLRSVTFTWWTPSSGTASATLSPAPPSGTVRLRPTEGGLHVLRSVTMVDAQGITTDHDRAGGEVVTRGADRLSRPNRLLDFAPADVGVRPDTPATTVRPRPGGAFVTGFTRAMTALRVEVTGGGSVVEVPAAPGEEGRATVGGLANGRSTQLVVRGINAYGAGRPATVSVTPVLAHSVAAVPATGPGRRLDVIAHRWWRADSDPDAHYAYPATGTGRLAGTKTLVGHSRCEDTGPADLLEAGVGDILCARTDGRLTSMAPGRGEQVVGSAGWDRMRWIDGGFDLDGDRRADVVSMRPSGELVLFRQTTKGLLAAPTRIGTGWQSMISVFSAGDLDGDRRNDVAAVDTAGRLWLYPGNGRGGVSPRRQIGSGWQGMGSIFAMRDFDGDGRADVGGVAMDGRLLMYRGTGTGGLRPGVRVGTGWHAFF
ncbi:FG-GAP repeat domain-containing protein [Phycicoccus avicenniae]|uniref:FG-GAP repeat domain-containing protein n=1 Tax=Phycicoccus avicenniae TaxID=2828860 RepID=UPI003D2C45D9